MTKGWSDGDYQSSSEKLVLPLLVDDFLLLRSGGPGDDIMGGGDGV